ncbi:hypothetical protein SAMN04488065_0735 [Haloplanus vescus]|uniref:Uncharacterized protein n=1 Tax=Haloplanus vescus TaxID=555874 RepID=A0A1H3WDW6_9EURY|nr:hypothetical protein [Haloplanus vescus]SDZ84542.1 hypothetical protein SAMN04488065_0735 [Haloplanus vescus]
MPNRDDEDLADLLAELERTLTDLRAAVDDDVRRQRRPPTPREMLRLTEEYTLPTIIALLEATVQSLELLRAVLRLSDPERTGERLRDQLSTRERGPTDATLRAAVTDLRDALTGADLPEDSAASSVVADARELTATIEERLREMEDERAADDATEAESRGVDIDVDSDIDDIDDSEADDSDIDAELESIRESVEDENDQ